MAAPTFVDATQASATGGTTLVLTKPTGTTADDILIAAIYTKDASSASITPPSGWTLLQSYAASAFFLFATYYRVAGASEGASYSFTVGGSGTIGALSAYRGADSGAIVSGISTGGSGTTSTCPSVTTTRADARVVVIAGGDEGAGTATTYTPPSGVTEREDIFSSALLLGLGDVTQSAAGSTGTKSWTSSRSLNKIGAVTVALQPSNTAPNSPTSLSPNGTTIDKDITQRFSWTFSDPDASDVQSAYDLRYQVSGSGSWTTVSGGATAYHDFAGGSFSAGDYEWQVRTTDNGGLTGGYSSSATFTAAATPTAPTISDPTSGGTVNSDPYVVTWTAPSQEAYQVRTVADLAGSPDTGTVYQDTGTVASSSTRSQSMTFATNSRTEHVQVRVRVSGLWSSWASHSVLVSYTSPPIPTITVTADDTTAAITIAVTNPAPSGSEPAVSSNEVWVRVALGGRQDVDRTVGDDGIRIATGVANGGSYVDRAIASGTDYQYRVRAIGDNDTRTYSSWS
jgi:hypothetical protein